MKFCCSLSRCYTTNSVMYKAGDQDHCRKGPMSKTSQNALPQISNSLHFKFTFLYDFAHIANFHSKKRDNHTSALENLTITIISFASAATIFSIVKPD